MGKIFLLFGLLICLSINCCLLIRPSKLVEEPKVAVAILWDTDTIFISGASVYTISGQDRILKLDNKTLIAVTSSAENLVAFRDKTKEKLLYSPDKIFIESDNDIIVGKNRQTMSRYRRKIVISNKVAHRFAVKYNLTAINILPIEEYLYGVVSCEIGMAKENEFEAIKAQAVCARSYTMALMGKRKDFDLYASYLYDQEYRGKEREYPSIIKAVQATRGEIVTFKDEPAFTQYHACCGGRTANGRYPYLVSIIDAPRHSQHHKPYCKDSPHFEWTVKISLAIFLDSLLSATKVPFKTQIQPKIEINKVTKRVEYIKFTIDREYKVPGEQVRKMFNLKSTLFNLKIQKDTVQILGNGWGHGIGMCQYGALAMARENISYYKILKHYYSGIKIKRIY
ncbi:MAG: SpoIID/LytB domain-containing protein [candidate division WOR-3 bacterium]|nr:SpoIID/LytB domain-containing protein [candidate division WOR-3 bacterium]